MASFMSSDNNTSGDAVIPTDQADFDPATVYAYEEGKDVEQENITLLPLVSHILDLFERAKTRRMNDEMRWLDAYRNYRGIYNEDVKFTSTEKSKAFVKITKTKVLASHAQLQDVLFSGNRFPIGIFPTDMPLNIATDVYFDPKEQDGTGATSDELPSTISRKSILDSLGPLKGTLQRLGDKLKEGVGMTPSAMTWEPAKIAAKNMQKLIDDQLEECEANKALRHFLFEMSLFGAGCMKGPFAIDKEYPNWDADGNYAPEVKTVAEISAPSIWDIYPDPFARNMRECETMHERHRFSASQLRKLKKRPKFRVDSIDKAIEMGPDYTEEYWEATLRDNNSSVPTDRYEVIEFWGNIDKELAKDTGLKIPRELAKMDEVQVNIWICNNQILRLVLNPFKPVHIPYYIAPYELNPYSFFGVGVAENMNDTQLLMNGFMRLAVDNAVLSSNVVFEVDETNLVPGQDMSIYPGKIFRRQGGAPGQALFATKFQNVTQECLMMFDKSRQLADESTGLPSYSHGSTGIMSTGRTASGMSMLMGAAAQNIKAVVKNIDDYLLAPLGKALFAFNMQFNYSEDIAGDLDVVALGTDSLMRNEIRSQKLMQFLQTTANPLDAPFVKREYILRELADSLDLDSDKVVNDMREATIQAEMLRQMGAQAPNGGQMGGAPSPNDPTQTGNGNISPGAAPEPGAQGFTGAGGGANSAPQPKPQGQMKPNGQ